MSFFFCFLRQCLPEWCGMSVAVTILSAFRTATVARPVCITSQRAVHGMRLYGHKQSIDVEYRRQSTLYSHQVRCHHKGVDDAPTIKQKWLERKLTEWGSRPLSARPAISEWIRRSHQITLTLLMMWCLCVVFTFIWGERRIFFCAANFFFFTTVGVCMTLTRKGFFFFPFSSCVRGTFPAANDN